MNYYTYIYLTGDTITEALYYWQENLKAKTTQTLGV